MFPFVFCMVLIFVLPLLACFFGCRIAAYRDRVHYREKYSAMRKYLFDGKDLDEDEQTSADDDSSDSTNK